MLIFSFKEQGHDLHITYKPKVVDFSAIFCSHIKSPKFWTFIQHINHYLLHLVQHTAYVSFHLGRILGYLSCWIEPLVQLLNFVFLNRNIKPQTRRGKYIKRGNFRGFFSTLSLLYTFSKISIFVFRCWDYQMTIMKTPIVKLCYLK